MTARMYSVSSLLADSSRRHRRQLTTDKGQLIFRASLTHVLTNNYC
jgi:hypothetical protein